MKIVKKILSVMFLTVLFSGVFLFFCFSLGISVETSAKLLLATFGIYIMIALVTLGIYALTSRFPKGEEGGNDN